MKKKALCIGINNYPGTGMDLAGCVNDANDWTQALQARGYSVTTLLDKQATKAGMVRAITRLIGGGARGDRLVITFSGHGTYQPDADGDEVDGLDEGLCPYDIRTAGPLIDDEIRTIFGTRKPGVRLLLIADSCHSGTVTRAAASEPEAEGARPRFMPMGNWLPDARLPRTRGGSLVLRVGVQATLVSPFVSGLSKKEGDLLLSGCQEGPNNYSYDARINGRPNGAFTYYALKTLKTLPAKATYTAWHKAIRAYLPSTSYPQSPQIVGNSAARKQKVLA